MKLTIILLAVCLAVPALAQDAPKFFRLDFTVKEVDDSKVVSTKSYSAFTTTDETAIGCSIRTGNRVPYQSVGGGFQYVDIGVNIDCKGKARESNGQLVLTITADISSVPSGGDTQPNTLPLVRQNRWNTTVILPIGKATTLFSSDDLNSKRKMQLELTATPVK